MVAGQELELETVALAARMPFYLYIFSTLQPRRFVANTWSEHFIQKYNILSARGYAKSLFGFVGIHDIR